MELCMMLNAKIQVASNLKQEFFKIIQSNTDSFHQNMVLDMKKCVQKAQKEHQVSMPLEKQIIDNYRFSEEWFTQAYFKLKKVCGGASRLVNVDFKEFTEVLACIQGDSDTQNEQMREMNELIKMCQGVTCLEYGPEMIEQKSSLISPVKTIQNSGSGQVQSKYDLGMSKQSNSAFKSQPRLVCAAKNLHQSLMRCQWMIKAQQLTGIGRFSSETGFLKTEEELKAEQKTRDPNKSKDIIEVYRLTKDMERLGIQVTGVAKEEPEGDEHDLFETSSETTQVFKLVNRLNFFAKEYERLFGKPQINQPSLAGTTTSSSCLKISNQISQLIVEIEEKNNLRLNQQDSLTKQKLESTVSSLQQMYQQLEVLNTQRNTLNITNNALLSNEQLETIFDQAMRQVSLCIEFNQLKIKNSPQFKLTIDQSQELLERAIRNNITAEAYIIRKLQKNIAKFEKFRRNYTEYTRFKQRQSLEVKVSHEDAERNKTPIQGFARDQSDNRFTQEFVESLIQDTGLIDIDILSERAGQASKSPYQFDIQSLKDDLDQYNSFKNKYLQLLDKLEKEIFEKQTQQCINEIKQRGNMDGFYKLRIDITELPIFDKQTYKRILAFVWIFNAYELLETGQINKDSPFHVQVDSRNQESYKNYMSIKQWKDFIKISNNFNSILPELKDHSIILQLQWQVEIAVELAESVKVQKNVMNQFNLLFNRGADYYKQQNPGDFYAGGQYDAEKTSGFFSNKIGDKLKDLSSHQNQTQGIIGPHLPKERLMSQFNKKVGYEDFIAKRDQAEYKLKINLSEELRYLNKWISEYEDLNKFKNPQQSDLIKENLEKSISKVEKQSSQFKLEALHQSSSFLYQPLFETHSFDQLKLIAKQVFVSPVYNWILFAILKKRLEIAYEIKQDLKYMLKEQEYKGHETIDSNTQKIKLSRIEPYLNQYWKNCRVKGIPEIENMISQLEESKKTLEEVKNILEEAPNDKEGIETEPLNPEKKLRFAKGLLSQLKFDFEGEENGIRTKLWHMEVELLQEVLKNQHTGNFKKLDLIEFKKLEKEQMRLKIGKNKENPNVAWFDQIKQQIYEVVKKLNSSSSEVDLSNLRKDIQSMDASKVVDLRQKLDDKNAKNNILSEKSEKSEKSSQLKSKSVKKSSKRSRSSGSSGSSSSSGSGSSSSGSSSSGSNSGSSSNSKSSKGEKEVVGQQQEGRSQRKIFKKTKDEIVVFKKEKRQKTGNNQSANSSESSGSEEGSPEKKKEAKNERKRAQKEFEKVKEKEKLNRIKALSAQQDVVVAPVNAAFGISSQFNQANMYNDSIFKEIQGQFSDKVRNSSKINILNAIITLKKAAKIEDTESQEQAQQLEERCYQVNYKVDDIFNQRINSLVKNIKLLEPKDGISPYSDVIDKLFISKKIRLNTMITTQPNFKNFASETQTKLKDNKQIQKTKNLLNRQADLKKPKEYFETLHSTEEKKESELTEKIIAGPQSEDFKEDQIDSNMNPDIQSADSENDFENDGAVFSSDEEEVQDQKPDQTQKTGSTAYQNPLELIEEVVNKEHKAPIVKYNPQVVLNQLRSQAVASSFDMTGQIEPILYDPLSKKSIIDIQRRLAERQNSGPVEPQILNQAEPGSLLKVWAGKLNLLPKSAANGDVTKSLMHLDMFSTYDIKAYQALPNWPQLQNVQKSSASGSLTLRGKSDINQVLKHFQMLHNDNKNVLTGWIAPRGLQQENQDNVFSHFEELKKTEKCSLFVLYDQHKSTTFHNIPGGSQSQDIKEVHLYIIPICQKTFDFCNYIGVRPTLEHSSQHPALFAFFIHIKHPFYSQAEKINISKSRSKPCLNPEVLMSNQELRQREHIPELPVFPGQNPFVQNHNFNGMIKDEPMQSSLIDIVPQQPPNLIQQGIQPPLMLPMFDPYEMDEASKIDNLILSLRTGNVRHQDIMQALLPYIKQKNISKESEMKLMSFISELIEQRQQQNAGGMPPQMPPQIPTQMPPQMPQQMPPMQVPGMGFQQPPQNPYLYSEAPQGLIKQEDIGSQFHGDMQQAFPPPQMPLPKPDLSEDQINQLIQLQSLGKLTKEQEILLQQQVERMRFHQQFQPMQHLGMQLRHPQSPDNNH